MYSPRGHRGVDFLHVLSCRPKSFNRSDVAETDPRSEEAHDLDRLLGPAQRPIESHAVPSLDDLRAAGTNAEYEAIARQSLEREGGHGQGSRRAGTQLHDGSPQPDPGRPGSQEGERSEGVITPGLPSPHRVDPETLGVLNEANPFVRERGGTDTDLERHAGPAPDQPACTAWRARALMPRKLASILVRYSSRRRSTIRSSRSGLASIAALSPERPGPIRAR